MLNFIIVILKKTWLRTGFSGGRVEAWAWYEWKSFGTEMPILKLSCCLGEVLAKDQKEDLKYSSSN